jgi:hypothetical protein
MSTIETVPYTPADVAERQAAIDGLRQLADFIEQHPGVPLPVANGNNAFVWSRETLAAIARTPGVRWEKGAEGNYFSLSVSFAGGYSYSINIEREQVCRKVVTGTRILPAQPEREVEECEWRCEDSLLAGAR